MFSNHKIPGVFKAVFLIAYFGFTAWMAAPLHAQDFPDTPAGHVNDDAFILSNPEKQQLETKLRAYRDSTSNVIVIATVHSLQGYSRQEVATTLFNTWRMWEGERQNGVLILVAPNERQMQIEVGYGLEGAVTDLQAGRIVDEILRPHFQQNDFYGGLDLAVSAIMALAAGEYDAVDRHTQRQFDPVADIFTLLMLIFFIYVIIKIGSNSGPMNGKRRRRYTLGPDGAIVWGGGFGSGRPSGGFGGGGFGGGGFGGFGGGGGFGSGGGGAGGGW